MMNFLSPALQHFARKWSKALGLAFAGFALNACVYVEPVAGYDHGYHEQPAYKTSRVAIIDNGNHSGYERGYHPRSNFVHSRVITHGHAYRPKHYFHDDGYHYDRRHDHRYGHRDHYRRGGYHKDHYRHDRNRHDQDYFDDWRKERNKTSRKYTKHKRDSKIRLVDPSYRHKGRNIPVGWHKKEWFKERGYNTKYDLFETRDGKVFGGEKRKR